MQVEAIGALRYYFPVETRRPACEPSPEWTAFCRINENRRAIRHFAPEPIADEDVQALLAQAVLAPSSANLQPYALHWVREPGLKTKLAAACVNQSAAVTAPALIVIAAGPRLAARTLVVRKRQLELAKEMTETSRRYHTDALRKFSWSLRLGRTGLIAPVQALLTLLWPEYGLLPFGPGTQRHWAARSAIYAAQTLLLAAVARGLDACPMEGFNPRAVTKLLDLPRGTVVPVVIALGRRAAEARVEPRWRLPTAETVVVH